MAASIDNRSEIIGRLQKDILRWQGFAPPEHPKDKIGLGPVEGAFPNGVFPIRAVHEFISGCREESAATSGFIGGLLSRLMDGGKVCLWIGTSRLLFPPAIKTFHAAPDRIIFVNMARDKDVRWAMEEALKCKGLGAVVAELPEMDFAQSRRLQLVVEKSGVTGLVLRSTPHHIGATACAARWHIKPLPSVCIDEVPGVGTPHWEVELLKVRNGNGGRWQITWSDGHFVSAVRPPQTNGRPAQWKKIS